jgi:hypothetical protein
MKQEIDYFGSKSMFFNQKYLIFLRTKEAGRRKASIDAFTVCTAINYQTPE